MTSFVPQAGERYVVTTPFEAIVMTHWAAPFTGGERRLLPEGLEFVIANSPTEGATAVYAMPEPHSLWEERLVAERDLKAEHYGGFSLCLSFTDVERFCASVGRAAP